MVRKKKNKKIRLLIVGSRGLQGVDLISKAVAFAGINIDDILEVVHGGAPGIDKAAGWWAEKHKLPVKIFKADWSNINVPNAVVKINGFGQYNAKAGIDRNEKMGTYSDVLVAIWDGKSRGTYHMIEFMKKLEKPFHVYEL